MRHVTSTSTDPALLVGLDAPDDAGVYEVAPGVALVQTVDFFTPIVDDPHDWGRIAAANALSDVYAMGGKPVSALNLVGWPRALDFALLGRVLEGAGAICAAAGVAILGGHSVDDPEPKFGLAVTGTVDPGKIVRKTGARPGDVLILTKPLGTGIISSGIKEGRVASETVSRAVGVMTALNRGAAEAMVEHGASAATDVTGYGLIGHLSQMLGDHLSVRLETARVPIIADAIELASEGILPGGSRRNREATAHQVRAPGVDESRLAVLFDAQTSGGLLIAISPDRAEYLLAAVRRDAPEAQAIGRFTEGDGTIEMAA